MSPPRRPAPSDPGQEAWAQIFDLIRADRARLYAVWEEHGLTPAQGHVMLHLEPGQPVPMRELADSLWCDASNVTGLIDKLEVRGLVARQPHPNDRRVKQLVFTERGEAMRAAILGRLAEPPPMIRALSLRDRRALRDILRRAVAKGEGRAAARNRSQ
jgi:MarR family transcriptional regulator, organic hydroperoxide resistance regulator